MRIIGNIIWIIFGGIFICIDYIVAGVAFCLTIVGIPFGIQCFKLGALSLVPFGREVMTPPRGMGALSVFFNIVWIVFFGWVIVLTHVALAVFFALTVIGLPFAVQHMKLARLAFTPFGLAVA